LQKLVAIIRPQVVNLQEFMVQVLERIRQVKTRIEHILPQILAMLGENEKAIVRTVIEGRQAQEQSLQVEESLLNRFIQQQRRDISQAEENFQESLRIR
jgi:hypothetical protein